MNAFVARYYKKFPLREFLVSCGMDGARTRDLGLDRAAL